MRAQRTFFHNRGIYDVSWSTFKHNKSYDMCTLVAQSIEGEVCWCNRYLISRTLRNNL